MIHLGITADRKEALLRELKSDNLWMRLHVRVLNADEDPLGSLTAYANHITSGQIDFDTNGDAMAVLSLSLVDPESKLRMDDGNPAHGAVFINRNVAVIYDVWLPTLQSWQQIPVFHGPLTGFEHDGVECSLEAMSKEVKLRDPHFALESYDLPKGMLISDAIQKVARRRGERRFRIPRYNGERLRERRAVTKWSEPWEIIYGRENVKGFKGVPKQKNRDSKKDEDRREPSRSLVRLLKGHNLAFYDNQGRLTVRKRAKHPVYAFKYARDFTTRPTISFDNTVFKNHVVCYGAKDKHGHRIVGEAHLHPTDPLSPHRLAWNGVKQYYTEKVTNESLKSVKECRKHAKEVLKRVSQQGIDAQFSCRPNPMLEPGDWVEVENKGKNYRFSLHAWTLPLVSGESMTIGKHERVRPHHRHRHHHRRGGGRAGPPGPIVTHGRGGPPPAKRSSKVVVKT